MHVVQLLRVMLLKHVKSKIKPNEKVRIPLMFELKESLNNVNDAVKAIIQNQSFANESNNDTDSDMLFCRSLVDSLRGLTPRKNKIARMKIQKMLFEVEFEDNTDI